jgi:hypothetical protein
MSDGVLMSNNIVEFMDKLIFTFKTVSISLLTICVSVIILVNLIKKANKDDPTGNAKSILIQKIIATLVGTIVIIISGLICSNLFYYIPTNEYFFNIMPSPTPIIDIITIITITLISCIYSPVAGFFVSLFGNIVWNSVISGYDVWFWLKLHYFFIPTSLYGLVIGFLWQKTIPNKINLKYISLFCLFQLICSIINMAIYFIPYLSKFAITFKEVIIYYIIATMIIGYILFIYKNKKYLKKH